MLYSSFQSSDPPGEILNQEDRKVERVVPNALSWARYHRLGDKPIRLWILLLSCFPD